ncbi:AraC family transcriptional regulator [Candidatus Pseudothioglobus singularis]|jgi:AraC-like DNA-binding protein|uniref:helix-turn-helix domain-containing protein n=1 Tax=Candidatus Pseudothioglobus singularis TaxID=1427364 RepID=UPI0008062520|nr:AraC family transcriptional regulator [Candidatus Pseudothioglobus singularis]ANQ66062.1 AraC family transcriptional regulator [Candidatus Pseudothioglobus singularis]MDB2670483.1 AraC family transcriptional regulator [Candidatus Pseudothioglobus singularis]|tara:strand:- start:1926 stop:2957 length:1032 start_codon:yes stop_codon:yes gene_type:complete
MNTFSGVWRCIQRLHQIHPYEVETIFQRVGIAKSLLTNQNVSIPVEILLNFVIDAQTVFKDELVSINFGRMAQVRPNYGEAFGLVFVYSKNLQQGLKLLQSFINTELEGLNFLIIEEKNHIKIQSVVDPKIKNPSIYENLGLSILASFIRSKRFQIKQINTKTVTQIDDIKEKSVFNCPVFTSCEETSLLISKKNYLKKNSLSNPNLVNYLSTILEAKANNMTSKISLTEKVERLMNNYENHFNLINIQDVSIHLGLSTNSLRNQLLKENTTFRKVLNNFKLSKSKNLLNGGLSVKVISYQLGYADPSSFVRWFIGQTDLTPSAYKLLFKVKVLADLHYRQKQ